MHYLYSRYSDDVCRFVQSIVRDHHQAEDITQDVFAKLMRAIQKYEEREVPFAAWIMRVARNAALDHVRSRRQIPVDEVWVSENGEEQHRSTARVRSRRRSRSCRSRNVRCLSYAISAGSRRTRSPSGWERPRLRSRDCTIAGARH